MTQTVDDHKDETLVIERLNGTAGVTVASRIKHVVQPGGRKNRHAMLLLLVGAATLAAIFWVIVRTGNQVHANNSPSMKRDPLSEPQPGNGSLDVPLVSGPSPYATLRPPPAEPVTPERSPVRPNDYTIPTQSQASSSPPAPRFAPSTEEEHLSDSPDETSTAPRSVFAIDVRGNFARAFRASKDSEQTVQPDKTDSSITSADARHPGESVKKPALPKGLHIPMKLLDPVATGVSSKAQIEVTADVLDSTKTVLIPSGSQGYLPFAEAEILGGRVTLDKNDKGLLTASGQEFELVGSIRGEDDRIGIAGKVKKSGSSNFGRNTLGIAERTASGIVGRTTGMPIYDTQILMEPQMMSGQNGMAREVVVEKGTKFTFIVGQ